MTENKHMKGIACCADCAYYNLRKHRCTRGCKDEGAAQDHFYRDCPLPDITPVRIGYWKQDSGTYLTPGGTPCYVCGACGGSDHLYGVEYPRRKVVCDKCGRINLYPGETAYEQGSSLWEADPPKTNSPAKNGAETPT